jgi:glyoxylase-like metal-dependent hydrolase (beta-lactamase superfamily II)
VKRFPGLEVWVHERGAPHLADPSKLIDSATRLYGKQMRKLWGRIDPVPAENLRPLRGGERLDGGFEVTYTPGHASHHVAYRRDRIAFVGDVGGVRIPPSGLVLMPTPPPDIDVEAWQVSIDAISTWHPRALAITHFGLIENPDDHLAAARRKLAEAAENARRLDRDAFIDSIRASVRREVDEQTGEVYAQAAPYDQLYLGLERYWEKRSGSK